MFIQKSGKQGMESNRMDYDELFMNAAVAQAVEAARLQEVPVGAVVVFEQQIIASAFNRRELDQDPTAHAEILALKQASEFFKSWRLSGATLYVTLEPCPMCAGALVNARVDRLVYACDDPKAGAVRSRFALCEDPRLNHRLQISSGKCAEICSELMKSFFIALRSNALEAPAFLTQLEEFSKKVTQKET